MFIVCDGDRPFELFLDGVDGEDVQFAIPLAVRRERLIRRRRSGT